MPLKSQTLVGRVFRECVVETLSARLAPLLQSWWRVEQLECGGQARRQRRAMPLRGRPNFSEDSAPLGPPRILTSRKAYFSGVELQEMCSCSSSHGLLVAFSVVIYATRVCFLFKRGSPFAFASGLACLHEKVLITYGTGDGDSRVLVLPLQRLDLMFACEDRAVRALALEW